MSIEAKIKELETQLEVKKAWLAVNVSFGRGNKISDEIKEAIVEQIMEYCHGRAENLENASAQGFLDAFTNTEIETLKALAAAAANRKPTQKAATVNTPQRQEIIPQPLAPKNPEAPLMLEVIRTDNIPYPESDSITVGEKVHVVGFKDEHVIIKTKEGKQFGILRECLKQPTQ